MKNKKIIGFLVIGVAFIFLAVYMGSLLNQVDTLNTALERLQNEDREVIETGQGDNEEQTDTAAAGQRTENTVIRDAERFLQAYYTFQNTTPSDNRNRIRPFVTPDLLSALFPDHLEDVPPDGYLESGIENMNTFYRHINQNTVEVLSTMRTYLRIRRNGDRIMSTMLFSAKMTYDGENERWVVSEILQNSVVNIINEMGS